MNRIKIHPTVFLLTLFPCVGILTWSQTGILWLSAAFHEAGHIIAYRICQTTMETIQVFPFGLCAVPKDQLKVSPANEVFCAAAGPIINLLIIVILLAFPISPQNEIVQYILYCNGSLFIINIFPILPLDGGRILYYALAGKFDASVCETVCRRCAILILSFLLFPVFMSLFQDKNPSLLMIWGYLAGYTALRRGSI